MGIPTSIIALFFSATKSYSSTMSYSLELHYNVTNLGSLPGEGLLPPTVVSLFIVNLVPNTRVPNDLYTASLAECGKLCAQYINDTAAIDRSISKCRSFTRFVQSGKCYGHLDPFWVPLKALNVSSGAFTADSGLVIRECESDFDCSFNGFSPRDMKGQNLSSWGGSIYSFDGLYHGWFAQMINYCGIGQWEQNSKIVHATSMDVLGPYIEKETVANVFSHEPCVTIDQSSGDLLM
eukprot:UC4_evm1s1139